MKEILSQENKAKTIFYRAKIRAKAQNKGF